MYPEERHRKILDILSHKKNISVKELSQELNVSLVTIRSDLAILANKNLVNRSHGGARIVDSSNIFPQSSYNFRSKKNYDLKEEIAKKAISFINPNECIVIDASSTAYELSKLINLANFRLTVITNGLMTAELLKDNPNITTILIGGVLKGKSNAIESTLGADILSKMNINTLFTSAQSFNLIDGLSDFNLYEGELKKLMVKQVDQVIALVDSTKLETTSVSTFLKAEEIDVFITDSKIEPDILERYSNFGLHVI